MYQFDQENGIVQLSQATQVRKVLTIFRHEDCKSEKWPMFYGAAPCEADCAIPYEGKFDMMGFVGHMQWLNMCTRPDISQVLKILSRHTSNFGKRHVECAKHLLRYLQGSIELGLTYRSGFPSLYQVFTDASHASCVDTRRSITSVVIKLGGNTVFWKSAFTTIVSHSSTESELMALDAGATASQALRWLIQAMGGAMQGEIPVFVDNHGAITLASNPVQSGRNCHIHAKYFYCRDLKFSNLLKPVPLPTEIQVADVGCTFKGGPTFLRLRRCLMECARIMHDESDIPQWQFMHDMEQ